MMKFVEAIEFDKENQIIIDGYSDKKAVESAIKDFGRYIEKHYNNETSGQGKDLVEYGKEMLLKASDSCGGYYMEVEEVGCASRLNDNDEMEYDEANYYLVVCFMK